MFSLEENQRKWVNGNWEWENTINLFLLYISFSVEFSFGDDQQPNRGNVFISSEMETRFFTENMNFLVWIIRIWSSAFHFPLLIGFGNGNEKCICNVLLLPRIHQFVQNLNGEVFLLRSVRCCIVKSNENEMPIPLNWCGKNSKYFRLSQYASAIWTYNDLNSKKKIGKMEKKILKNFVSV